MIEKVVTGLERNSELDENYKYAYSNESETYYFDEETVGDYVSAYMKQDDIFVFVSGKIFIDESTGKYWFNKSPYMQTLTPTYDAVSVTYPGFRMPTKEECQELAALHSDFVYDYNDIAGLNGRVFTGTNGNTLFIPAAGYANDGSSIKEVGRFGFLWSNLSETGSSSLAWYFAFDSDDVTGDSDCRYFGYPVHPVQSI